MNNRTLAVIAAIGAVLVAILASQAMRTGDVQNPPVTTVPNQTP